MPEKQRGTPKQQQQLQPLYIHILSSSSDEMDPALLTFPRHFERVAPAGEAVVLTLVVIPVLLPIDSISHCKLDHRAQLEEERRHGEKESEDISLTYPILVKVAAVPMSTHFMHALPLVEGVAHRHLLLKGHIENLDSATDPQVRAGYTF